MAIYIKRHTIHKEDQKKQLAELRRENALLSSEISLLMERAARKEKEAEEQLAKAKRLEALAAELTEELTRYRRQEENRTSFLRHNQLYIDRSLMYKRFMHEAEVSQIQHRETLQVKSMLSRRRYGIVVKPESAASEDARTKRLLSKLAANGYLCIYCREKQSGEEFALQQEQERLFVINDAKWLLPSLQTERVTVLLTRAMQDAWHECIPDKLLWYDLCEETEKLFEVNDPFLHLKHWQLLNEASMVTYAAERLRQYAYFRQDAVLMPLTGEQKAAT